MTINHTCIDTTGILPQPPCPGCQTDWEVRVRADAQALADVRTLDEWAETELGRAWRSSNDGLDRRVTLYADQRIHQVFAAKTPTEARAKAAAWVREQKT